MIHIWLYLAIKTVAMHIRRRVFNVAELLQYTPTLCLLFLFSHLAFYGDVFLCGILLCLMVDDGSHLVVQ